MTQHFYSHGKLLLTGEYVVLDGAKSLALPTKKGQSLEVTHIDSPQLIWKSILHDKRTWLDTGFKLPLHSTNQVEDSLTGRLQQILVEAQKLNPSLLETGVSLKSSLEFDKSWGLGSSSTLLYNIAQWAKIDPYKLLANTFGGSGYDIACAAAVKPIVYQILNGVPSSKELTFNPEFKEELFFVYLNRKQNSRESIAHYRNAAPNSLDKAINEISEITLAIIDCKQLVNFEQLLETHEAIIASLIKTPTIKSQLFPGYPRSIKSLGGWGGDFVLASGGIKEQAYFKSKGYTTILPFSEMVL